jgi:hypothetical protein
MMVLLVASAASNKWTPVDSRRGGPAAAEGNNKKGGVS